MLINYVSIKQTIGRFFKDLGIDETSYVNDIPQWTEDAIEIIGIPNYYVFKFKLVKIDQNRGVLPCDIQNLHSVFVTSNFQGNFNRNNARRLVLRNAPLIGKGISTASSDTAYANINGNFINTSFYSGYVYFVYKQVYDPATGKPIEGLYEDIIRGRFFIKITVVIIYFTIPVYVFI